MQPLRRLQGTEDQGPEATRVMARAGDALTSFLARYGYRRVYTPLLEETELLLRKSGGELASKMYTFTDPGGHRVSLRPEFTSSVVRAYLQGMHSGALPVRWSYMGPVFRYEPDDGTEHRQFTQVGAELIGAAGSWADAEVLAVACKGLSHLGITGYRLTVGHLGFIGALLESLGLSDRARLFLLASVATLSRGADGVQEVRQRAEDLGLLSETGTRESLQDDVSTEAALALLEQHLQTPASPAIGVRTPQEIRERFLRKQQFDHDAERFGQALDLLVRVVQTSGAADAVLKNVHQMVESSQARREVDYLSETLDALSHYQLDVPVSVDFGLGRGIAYYTGVVFEVRHPTAGGVSLGGGGRYDGLVQALGGTDQTPAMGFAWSLEHVVAALAAERKTRWTRRDPAPVLVRPEEPSAMAAALREAERLRKNRNLVELEVNGRSLDECIDYARGRGILYVVSRDAMGGGSSKYVPRRTRKSSPRNSQ